MRAQVVTFPHRRRRDPRPRSSNCSSLTSLTSLRRGLKPWSDRGNRQKIPPPAGREGAGTPCASFRLNNTESVKPHRAWSTTPDQTAAGQTATSQTWRTATDGTAQTQVKSQLVNSDWSNSLTGVKRSLPRRILVINVAIRAEFFAPTACSPAEHNPQTCHIPVHELTFIAAKVRSPPNPTEIPVRFNFRVKHPHYILQNKIFNGAPKYVRPRFRAGPLQYPYNYIII